MIMNNQKWWQDNDRYIPDPWAEVTRLEKELEQMSITEAALRESLTCLSRESNEYRHKIETENALLLADKARLDWLEANHYLVDFINEDVEPTQKGVFICTNGSNSQTAITIRSAIDAAIEVYEPN